MPANNQTFHSKNADTGTIISSNMFTKQFSGESRHPWQKRWCFDNACTQTETTLGSYTAHIASNSSDAGQKNLGTPTQRKALSRKHRTEGQPEALKEENKYTTLYVPYRIVDKFDQQP